MASGEPCFCCRNVINFCTDYPHSNSIAEQIADLREMLSYLGLFVHQLTNTFAGVGDTAVVAFAEILADSDQRKPGECSR